MWKKCLEYLQEEYPAQQFNTWLRPLQAQQLNDELQLYAPNKFVLDWVADKYLGRIREILSEIGDERAPKVVLRIGSVRSKKDIERSEERRVGREGRARGGRTQSR